MYCCYAHMTYLASASQFLFLFLCLSFVLCPLVFTGWASSCLQITPVALCVIATCTDTTHTDTFTPLCHFYTATEFARSCWQGVVLTGRPVLSGGQETRTQHELRTCYTLWLHLVCAAFPARLSAFCMPGMPAASYC